MILKNYKHYTYSETVAHNTNGTPVYVNPVKNQSGKITCTIISSGTSGKVQFTTSSEAAIAAGTATWQDWPKGVVTATTSDVLVGPVTAVRGVSVSGDVTFEVVV